MKIFSNVNDLLSFAENHELEINLRGMIKEGDDDSSIFYTPTGCNVWISIAKDCIVESTFISNKACQKEGEQPHFHPYVQLRIIPTRANNGEYLRVIASLQESIGPAPQSVQTHKPGMRYFGNVHLLKPIDRGGINTLKDNCGDLKCYYVGDQCPYGCACVGDDGMGYCSTCCVA